MGQQTTSSIYQLWYWLIYEASVHPVIFLGIAIVIVSAWFLYKAEVRTK